MGSALSIYRCSRYSQRFFLDKRFDEEARYLVLTVPLTTSAIGYCKMSRFLLNLILAFQSNVLLLFLILFRKKMKPIASLFLAACLGIWSLFLFSPTGLANEELLPAEAAFIFAAEQTDEGIEVKWGIADGYYMYRDKMSFKLGNKEFTNSDSLFPDGIVKSDELFGEVEVYTKEFKVHLPLPEGTSGDVELIANGQGCNEPIGVCYPPMEYKQNFTFASLEPAIQETDQKTEQVDSNNDQAPDTKSVPQDDAPEESTLDQSPSESTENTLNLETNSKPALNEVNDVQDLRDLLAAGFQQPEFLEVDEAFKVSIETDSSTDKRINIRLEVEPGYYLYRDKIEFPNSETQGIQEVSIPEGEIKQDEYFGEVEVFKTSFNIIASIDTDARSDTRISIRYQGCAENGICYSPVEKRLDVSHLPPSVLKNDEPTTPVIDTQPVRPIDTNEPAQKNISLLTILAGAFVAGLLLTFTPCVLPMIPILSSFIVGQGDKLTKLKGGLLSIFYVLGTAVTYAAMGALAGATGDQLQAYFQNIWAIGLLSGLFLVMSLGMFGVFNLQLPASVQSRIQNSSSNLSGSIPLVFLFGLISALIVGACVSPVLISTLSVAVSQRDPVLGAQMMFTMALGMGVPLLALGFGAGYLVPKAGNWMNTIKYIFGILLIAVAIYLLQSVPQVPILFLWASFFIILSVYLGATQSDFSALSGLEKLEKGIGIILLVWGIICLIGAALGQRDVLQPIPQSLYTSSAQPGSTKQLHVDFQRIDNERQLEAALAKADEQNRFIMIDYYADWCTDCIRMEKTTFSDPDVVTVMDQKFIALQVDVTDPNDVERKKLKTRFNVFGPPAVLFLDSQGNELKEHHFYGYRDSQAFLAILSKL